MGGRVDRGLAVAMVAAAALTGACRSAASPSRLGPAELAAAAAELGRPLPGELLALYRLRVRSSGGLRLAVQSSSGGGRLSVAEPFGGLVSLVSWTPAGAVQAFDMKAGCRLERADVEALLGLPALPLGRMVALLGGRLPAAPGDRVEPTGSGRLRVEGPGFGCEVEVRPSPWRVVRVSGVAPTAADDWQVELERHDGAVPASLRVARRDGRWLRLDLTRLEWGAAAPLPALPELDPCPPAGVDG